MRKEKQMPTQERHAQVIWEGNLVHGNGTLRVDSGAFPALPVSWPARTEQSGGKTSPEELLAAAQAVCYAMALSHTLTQKGTPPQRLDVSATCTVEIGSSGLKISTMDITVKGQVPGIQQADFEAATQQAEKGCPVANAIRNNVDIHVHAQLETSPAPA
jgi:osmotically inducible protein OsmC